MGVLKPIRIIAILLPLFALLYAQTTTFQMGDRKKGMFWRVHWFEDGAQHGNPGYQYNRRFRVNSFDVILHPHS